MHKENLEQVGICRVRPRGQESKRAAFVNSISEIQPTVTDQHSGKASFIGPAALAIGGG